VLIIIRIFEQGSNWRDNIIVLRIKLYPEFISAYVHTNPLSTNRVTSPPFVFGFLGSVNLRGGENKVC
jgi:hypothetical protein